MRVIRSVNMFLFFGLHEIVVLSQIWGCYNHPLRRFKPQDLCQNPSSGEATTKMPSRTLGETRCVLFIGARLGSGMARVKVAGGTTKTTSVYEIKNSSMNRSHYTRGV
jgi:hypothetical protein